MPSPNALLKPIGSGLIAREAREALVAPAVDVVTAGVAELTVTASPPDSEVAVEEPAEPAEQQEP